MREKVATRARQAIEESVFPGCVIGIIRANSERKILRFGRFTYEKDSPDVAEDSIYDLASVTKSIPVASLAALFESEGRFSFNDKVLAYIPELKNHFDATIEDLLRYRVHGPQMSALKFTTFEQVRTHIFEQGFDTSPGESVYTNLPAFLLAIILERVGGEILPSLSQKYFFEPLKMNDTTFFSHDLSRVAPTEVTNGIEVHGIVHDESARMFAKKRRAVGHAGLFSTAPDLLRFLEALLQGKFPPIITAAQKGLGWQSFGEAFGKTGFTGTSVHLDTKKGIGIVILSNRTFPKRPSNGNAINSFRSDIADIVFNS